MNNDNDPFEYFYVAYQGNGIGGAIILPQHKLESGEENPDGFNVASASRYLYMTFNAPVIVLSWHRTTKKRREEFEAFVQSITPNAPETKKRHLSLVPLKEPTSS